MLNLARAATVLQNHKIYLSISLCTLSGAFIYTMLKSKQNRKMELENVAKQLSRLGGGIHKVKLIVENDLIPKLRGAINDIEEQTNTSIAFTNANQQQGTHQICIIVGDYENVKAARVCLLKEVERLSIVKEEIQVSRDLCLSICESDSDAVKQLSRLSSAAKVSYCLERDVRTLKIVVSGTKQEVNTARKLIESTVQEWENMIRSKTNCVATTNQSTCASKTKKNEEPPDQQQQQKKNLFEVYISAIASPSKFWIQLVGQPSCKLIELSQSMTAFYSQPHNRVSFHLKKPQFGQLVAVQFPRDNKWYRAEIIGANANKANPKEIHLDLYFVDYGNSEFIAPCYVYELHTQFISLSYQAAECFLANVTSNIPNKPETWDDDSINYFEKLTELSDGKKLICQVVTYNARTSTVGGRKRVSDVPGIELFYTLEGVVVNVGQALISHGLAQSISNLWSTAYDAEILKSKTKNQIKEHDAAGGGDCLIGISKSDAEFMENSKNFMQHTNRVNMTTSYDEQFYATSKLSTITKQEMHSKHQQKIVTRGN